MGICAFFFYSFIPAQTEFSTTKEVEDIDSTLAVIAYFNKNYVNKDVFSRDMGRKISKLEIIRHKSDYDDFYIASKLDTVNQVTIAKEIIGEIKTYLNME